jgi:putative phosphotransacetylase
MGRAVKNDVRSDGLPRIPLGVSNRHIHITRMTFSKLFGEGAELKIFRELYQTGEFASKQQVTLVGSRMRAIENVRILGPFRDYDQAEISLTDAIGLGIKPPVRNSGDLQDAAPLTLAGPRGSVFLEACAIIASRHIHMPPDDAPLYGVRDGSLCRVRIGGVKSTIFENVLIRVREGYKLQMHLDTDDANAANVRCNTSVEFAGLMEG